MFRLLALVALTGLVTACAPPDPVDPPPTGRLTAHLVGTGETDVAVIRLEVRAAEGGQTVASANIDDAESEHAFVLPAATYDVHATPLDEAAEPSADCLPATAANVEVVAGEVAAVDLVLVCNTGATGSLQVTVRVGRNPVITNVRSRPSTTRATCQPMFLHVDTLGDDLTYTWSVPAADENVELIGSGANARLVAMTPGPRTLLVEASDGEGRTATLQVPVEIEPGEDGCLDVDEDGDGHPDVLDNCPSVANPDQLDANLDGLGDVCTAPGGPMAITVNVDPGLEPAVGALANDPAVPDGGRPVARMTGADGLPADFVTNELIVLSTDPGALDAFVADVGGQVLNQLDPELGDGLVISQVRLTPPAADPAALIADVRAIDPIVAGEINVSSQAGLDLLALAARTTRQRRGVSVTINLLLPGAGIAERSTTEAPVGVVGFNPDAFTWDYMRDGGAIDTGAAEGLRLLQASGADRNRVRMAILDGGFINADLTARAQTFGGGFGVPNPGSCGGGACDWHGADTSQAACGLVDNGFGAAGSAGTICDPLLVQSPNPDFFAYLRYIFGALPAALGSRPQIANISAGAQLPAAGCLFLCPPIDLVFHAVRRGGTLVYASAGNENIHLDAKDCLFGACWEEGAYIPCEARDVECVGALALGARTRAGYSNWGTDPEHSVDISGPGSVWTYGRDAAGNPLNQVNLVNGTSVASPFVAGCAAQVWAARPGQSPDAVANIIRFVSNRSSDPRVDRTVDCLGATRRALGNAPPFVRITAPADGASFVHGLAPIDLRVAADDLEDGTPTVRWFSNRDGLLGTGTQLAATLSVGVHTLRAIALDRAGAQVSQSITISVTAPALSVTINTPPQNGGVFRGALVPFRATGFDQLSPNGLPANAFTWTLDGNVMANAPQFDVVGASLALGQHTARVDVTAGARTAFAEVTFTVNADPPELPPTVWASPLRPLPWVATILEGSTVLAEVGLRGDGIDAGGQPLPDDVFEWLDDDGELLAVGRDATVWLPAVDNVPVTHLLTLRVTDPAGVPAEVEVPVDVVPGR